MPELPDVEVFKKYVDSTSLHQRIQKVDAADMSVIKNIQQDDFEKNLKGQTLERTFRHGKYLFLKLSGCNELLLHFGMTGFPVYYKKEDKTSDHTRLLFTFENEYHFAFDCQRKLGEVRIVEDYQDYIDDLDLGPDALGEELDFMSFKRRFENRRGMIKPALMNQKIVAGIGNVYSDEILYQARLHPKSKVPDLQDKDWQKIYDAMIDVLRTAIDCSVDETKMPEHFVLSNREEGADCPKGCGDTLQKLDVSGRSALYCPGCQKKR